MKQSNPIGIFDSGVGGLSVALGIRQELPTENLLYVSDSFYAPYGNKPLNFIEQRSQLLVGDQIKIIDTAEAVAKEVRRRLHTANLLTYRSKSPS